MLVHAKKIYQHAMKHLDALTDFDTNTEQQHIADHGNDPIYMSTAHVKAIEDDIAEIVELVTNRTELPDWIESKLAVAASHLAAIKKALKYRQQ